jgi:Purple acid Phosphatase, N-terminal domain/Calcineurin-like phosphoesterase/Fibronectin type III domain
MRNGRRTRGGTRSNPARRSWRRVAVVAVVSLPLGVLSATSSSAAFTGASPQLTRAPYLTDATSSSMQATWATTTQSKQTVKWGAAGGSCAASSATSSTSGTPITVNGVTEYQNSVTIPGLSAGAAYCYRVFTGGTSPVDLLGSLASPTFRTLDSASSTAPFTFAVVGDWGDTTNSGVNNGTSPVNLNQAGVLAGIAGSGARFVLGTGDTAYPSGTQTNYGDLNQTGVNISSVFGPSYWTVPGQKVPYFGALGNHGRNKNYINIWPESVVTNASGGTYAMQTYPDVDGDTGGSYPTEHFAFSTGGARFYILDADWSDGAVGTATGGACGVNCAKYQVDADQHWPSSLIAGEYQWLKADLAAHPGGLKFAVFHFPLRSDDQSNPDDAYLKNTPGTTGTLEQLLHDYGVSMVFNGHAHIYQRNVAPPGGVTSYVSGGGGAKSTVVSKCSPTDAYARGWSYSSAKGDACGAAPVPTADSQIYHFLEVSVSGSSVTVTPTDSQGQTFDTTTYKFAADTTVPSAPGSLTATKTSSTKVTLNWTAASDNVGVYAYDVYRDGALVATVPSTVLKYADSGLVAGSTHTWRVDARDLAANVASASVSNGSPPDTTPPTAPGAPTATNVTSSSVTLSWTAATDNVAVTGYDITRGGTVVGTVTGSATTYTDPAVSPSTTYSYAIVAKDAAGNSTTGASTSVTTPAATVIPVFSDGFESGPPLSSAWTTQQGLVVQSALSHTGSYAARETSTGTATYAYATVPSATEYWAQGWVYVASNSTSANFFGFRTGTSSAASIVNVYITSTGKLSLRNNIGLVTTTSTKVVSSGTWHKVVLHAIVNGANSSLAVSLDGVTVPDLTLAGQDLGTTPIGRLQVGDTTTARSYDIAIDDVAVATSPL